MKKERILLSTFIIKVLDNNKNEQLLSQFNGTNDFINVYKKFVDDIFKSIAKTEDDAGNVFHLTLEEPAKMENDGRKIHGFFSSGVGGDNYTIKDTVTNVPALEVKPHHAAFRDLFFYLEIPINKKEGYLVLQRKNNFGIKILLLKVLNTYLKKEYSIYKVSISNILPNQVYKRMFEQGNLSKVELVKRKIPDSIEEYFKKGGNPNLLKGKLKTVFIPSLKSLPDSFKEYVGSLFSKEKNSKIEISDSEYDECQFELELNGKKKTFYISNRERVQSDVDVSENISRDNNGKPTIESLITQAKELIEDVIKQKISDVK